MEVYLYFAFRPAAVGGCSSPYFLQTAEEIQNAVQKGPVPNRDELRKRNAKELDEEALKKKGRTLLTNTKQSRKLHNIPLHQVLEHSTSSSTARSTFAARRSPHRASARTMLLMWRKTLSATTPHPLPSVGTSH
jgi:hypothetical protein